MIKKAFTLITILTLSFSSFGQNSEKAKALLDEVYATVTSYENIYIDFKYTLENTEANICLLYTSPSPRDRTRSRMPSSA